MSFSHLNEHGPDFRLLIYLETPRRAPRARIESEEPVGP
jgi:hypothetical protein